MISENEYSGGGDPDSGNIFNVRSDDGGKTLVWDIEGTSAGVRPKKLSINAKLDRAAALNLFAWGVAISGIDLVQFVRQVENISKREILTSDEKAQVAFALGALEGDYIARAKENKITAWAAHAAGEKLRQICSKLSQL